MEVSEFRNAVFGFLSNEGFVQSYKTQLRLAIHKVATGNRNFAYPAYQHSLRSELICNIIAEYFKKYGYQNALHVFIEESGFHKFDHDDLLRNTHLTSAKKTILEALIQRRKRPTGQRSVETQTNTETLVEKLAMIDSNIKSSRANVKAVERQRMVKERLQRIREERQAQLQERLHHAYEAQRALEMSRIKVESAERFRTEMHRMRAEFDAQLLRRTQELRMAREQEEATHRLLQQELDRQLARLRESGNPQVNESEESMNIENLKKKSNAKINKVLLKAQKLVKARELVKSQIAQEKLSHRQTLNELNTLRERFVNLRT